MVLSRRQARPGLSSASGGGATTHRSSREWGLEKDLSTVPNRHSQSQCLCHDQQQAHRGELLCHTVKVFLPGQLVLTPSCSESRLGRVIVVLVHPTYRERLDPPVANPGPHTPPCSRRCPRCTWLRLLTHFRDLCYCHNHAAAVRVHTPRSLRQRFREVDQVISAWLPSLALSHTGRQVSRMRPPGQAARCCPLVAVSQLIHLLVAEADLSCVSGLSDVLVASKPFPFSLSTQQISVAVRGWHWAAFQRGSFLSPAAAFGGLPLVVAAVFHGIHSHVCDSFRRPTPVLCQTPDSSRAENPRLAPNSVFVCVRVPAHPTVVYKLCLAASALLASVPESTLPTVKTS